MGSICEEGIGKGQVGNENVRCSKRCARDREKGAVRSVGLHHWSFFSILIYM